MVTMDAVQSGVAKFAEREIVNKLPSNDLKRVLVGTAIAVALKKSDTIAQKVSNYPAIRLLGVIDDQGNVDIDTLKEALKCQISDDGVVLPVPVLGDLKFFRHDIENLYADIVGR